METIMGMATRLNMNLSSKSVSTAELKVLRLRTLAKYRADKAKACYDADKIRAARREAYCIAKEAKDVCL